MSNTISKNSVKIKNNYLFLTRKIKHFNFKRDILLKNYSINKNKFLINKYANFFQIKNPLIVLRSERWKVIQERYYVVIIIMLLNH